MRHRGRVGIRDVAAAANVSVTTVSHVLNQKGRVEPETRERVRRAADELGYVPNRVGQGLVSGRSLTLGLSLPSIGDIDTRGLLAIEWFSNFTVLASAAAIDHGYVLAVLPALQSAADVARYGLDGVLVLEPTNNDPRIDILKRASTPHVSVGGDPSEADAPRVPTDVAAGGTALFRHLINQGSRRILVMSGPPPSGYITGMLDAALAVCQPVGAGIEHAILGGTATSTLSRVHIEATEVATDALIRHNPVDTIVCLFESGGATVLAAAQRLGVSVPNELRIAQDVDDSTATRVTPAITVLDQHPELQAEAGIALLLHLLDNSPGPKTMAGNATPVTLVVREST